MERLLKTMIAVDATDLHVQVGAPPAMRVTGLLRPVDAPALTEARMEAFVDAVLSPTDRRDLSDSSANAKVLHRRNRIIRPTRCWLVRGAFHFSSQRCQRIAVGARFDRVCAVIALSQIPEQN